MRRAVVFGLFFLAGADCSKESADVDASVKDASIADTPKVPNEASPFDATYDVVVDPCYPPPDVSGFTPSAKVHVYHAKETACSSAAIDSAWTACIDTASTSTTCAAFKTADATCASCIFSKRTDAQYGAVIERGLFDSINASGCIALETGDTSMAGCAYRTQSRDECTIAACWYADECPVEDGCLAEAKGNGCKTYDDAAVAACTGAAMPPTCSGTDAKSTFVAVASAFCLAGD